MQTMVLGSLCTLVYCLGLSAFFWTYSVKHARGKRHRATVVIVAHLIGVPLPYLFYGASVWMWRDLPGLHFTGPRLATGMVGLLGLGCLLSALLGMILARVVGNAEHDA